MDPAKVRLRKFLELTRSERRGIFLFTLLIVSVTQLKRSWHVLFPDDFKLSDHQARLDSFHKSHMNERMEPSFRDQKEISMHAFDPNEVSKNELLTLGLPEYLSERIVKFRSAGGKFRKADDLMRIYGMKEELFRRLKPYVNIPEEERNAHKTSHREFAGEMRVIRIDLNEADSASLTALRGIGPVFATRITRYRHALGGFHEILQLKEVYGIDDSLYKSISPYIVVEGAELKKVRINHGDQDELREHPYLRSFSLVRSIVRYREQHGPYRNSSDLMGLHLMSDSLLKKLGPYLDYSLESDTAAIHTQ